jgi:hypothetical protein
MQILTILVPWQCPLKLNNIRLKTSGYVAITELGVHMEKLLNHCCLGCGSTILSWNWYCWSWMMSSSSVSTIMLCMIIKAVITSYMVRTFHVLAVWRTIAYSTSFLQDSCLWANLFVLSVVGLRLSLLVFLLRTILLRGTVPFPYMCLLEDPTPSAHIFKPVLGGSSQKNMSHLSP